MKPWHKFVIVALGASLLYINFELTIVYSLGVISGVCAMIAIQVAEDKAKDANPGKN